MPKTKKLPFPHHTFNCCCKNPPCGKLYIGDYGDGTFEIGFIKYPNRKKLEGSIYVDKITLNMLLDVFFNHYDKKTKKYKKAIKFDNFEDDTLVCKVKKRS